MGQLCWQPDINVSMTRGIECDVREVMFELGVRTLRSATAWNRGRNWTEWCIFISEVQYYVLLGAMAATSRNSKLKELVNEFGSQHFSITEETILCKVFTVEFKSLKRYELKRHCNSNEHKSNVNLSASKEREATFSATQSHFFEDVI